MRNRSLQVIFGFFAGALTSNLVYKKFRQQQLTSNFVDSVPENKKRNAEAYVYTWFPKDGGIGHQSIEVIYGDIRKYISYWPAGIGGIFASLMPIVGFIPKLSKSVEEDALQEGSNPVVLQIKNLDGEELIRTSEEIITGAQTGALCYQFFPNVTNLLWLVCQSAYWSKTPNNDFACNVMEDLNEISQLGDPSFLRNTTNCTKSVDDILNAGGFRRRRSSLFSFPWHAVPSTQFNTYKKMGAVEITENEMEITHSPRL